NANGVAIWVVADLADITSIHASSFIQGQWRPVETVATGDAITTLLAPNIALDAAGDGVSVWEAVELTDPDPTLKIQSAVYRAKEWQTPETIASATNRDQVLKPNVALNGVGQGGAVWFAQQSATKSVQFLAFKDGAWSTNII